MADSPNRTRCAHKQPAVRKATTRETTASNRKSVDLETASSAATGAISSIPKKVDILGMDFDNYSMSELLTSLRKGVIFTPNVDHLMKLRSNPEFAAVYRKADIKVCDSQIIMYASKFLGSPLKEKVSGSDLFPLFCDYHRYNENVKIFLLGGLPGVARRAQSRINHRIGRRIVVGEYSPPLGFERDPQECRRILSVIEQSSANVVAVCLGAPKQEKWIAANCERLPNIDIFMAVGAVVDFEAGTQKRAPRYLSQLGLEWLYRLLQEPRRLWRRYLVEGMPFFGLILVEKFRRRKTR
ncbi:MAG: WecB/TagA/CpsF family glycosyltransferase [Cyanobacteria bacterium P01_D01_bin.1]